MYQSSTTSQDGLAEAIQLLSCRPSRAYQPTLGQSFAEEQPSHSVCIYATHIPINVCILKCTIFYDFFFNLERRNIRNVVSRRRSIAMHKISKKSK